MSWLSNIFKGVSLADAINIIQKKTSGRDEAIAAVLRFLYPGRTFEKIRAAVKSVNEILKEV